ncbi:complexin-1 isoform X1 [Pelodiscus sinensis]|uniref:complexin-1 isoform X1 n=1 Tax=Pelodiscus sinensis TaxID=13735 RepID=UPI003F6C1A48
MDFVMKQALGGATKDMGKMLGGDEEKDPDAAKKEEERQEALRQEEEERKAKYAKMEAEREVMRQGIRDKATKRHSAKPTTRMRPKDSSSPGDPTVVCDLQRTRGSKIHQCPGRGRMWGAKCMTPRVAEEGETAPHLCPACGSSASTKHTNTVCRSCMVSA